MLMTRTRCSGWRRGCPRCTSRSASWWGCSRKSPPRTGNRASDRLFPARQRRADERVTSRVVGRRIPDQRHLARPDVLNRQHPNIRPAVERRRRPRQDHETRLRGNEFQLLLHGVSHLARAAVLGGGDRIPLRQRGGVLQQPPGCQVGQAHWTLLLREWITGGQHDVPRLLKQWRGAQPAAVDGLNRVYHGPINAL